MEQIPASVHYKNNQAEESDRKSPRIQTTNEAYYQQSTSTSHLPSNKAFQESSYIEKGKDVKKTKKSSGFCCCCQTRGQRIGCGIFWFFFLIGLAIAAYFCWPRGMPQVNFQKANLVTSNSDITRNAIPALTTGGTGSLGIDIDLILKVHNPNLISIKLSNITATGFYNINGKSVNVGKGALNQTVTFPATGDLTFPLPFHLLYTASDPDSQAALKDLISRCGILGGARQPLSMSYKAELDIALISWLGIRPTITNNISFDCPITM